MSEDSASGGETPLLRSAKEILRLTLGTLYRIPPSDCARFERELLVWFDRLRRRPGAPKDIPSLRSQLIVMACRAGHVYWTSQPDAVPAGDRQIDRTLALGPDAVAAELESRLAPPKPEPPAG